MDTVKKLQEISLRIDQIDQTSEWLMTVLGETDPSLAQAGAMMSALADDVRLRVLELVSDLEARVAMICEQLEKDSDTYH